jgi:NADPH:quinone reductase
MLALVADRSSTSGVSLREAPDALAGPSETLVEVKAISLNRGEVRRLPARAEGTIPGWDVAGVTADGTRVVGLADEGAWAQLAAVPTDRLVPLPDGVSFEAASTLPVAGLTAVRLLEVGGPLLGRRVLITGAAGGVGRFAVQLAHRGGAQVTGIVGRPDRAQGLAELGTDQVVMGLERQGDPFDLILESVGGTSLAAAIDRLGPEGLIVSIGNSSNETTSFDSRILYRKGAPRIEGFFVTWELLNGRIGSEELSYLASLAATGRFESRIDFRVGWHDAVAAVDALLERRVAGKAVLTID